MRLAAGPAAAATDCRYATATATASDAACPRLTGGEGRLEDPILDPRLSSNDLTAIDRAQASVDRRGSEESPALAIACAPVAGTRA
jgi:hypothetical protein